ncbi:MAG: sodium:solute symporter [Rickettsiaceae bacterium]
MSFDIDSTIFVGFLAFNLILGLLSSRGIRTIKSYAVGDGDFSTATIVSTIVATWVSGEFFFTIIVESYTHGLFFIVVNLIGDFLGLVLIGIVFAPRMAEFLGKLSIAEAMGDLYGKKVRAITAISGFIGVSGIIAIQLKIAGILFEQALGIPVVYGILLSGITITLYSSLGGIKSVTFTDIVQFFAFGVVIPTIAYFLFSTIENNQIIIDALTNNPLFDYSVVFSFSNPKIYYYFSIFFWIAIPAFNPAIFQRIAMARDVKQVRYSFIIASIVCLILAVILLWISILILSLYPNIKEDEILHFIISDYTWITGFKGIILAGIMAMVMSATDSYINSSSVLLVHDLRESLSVGFIKNELFVTRICSMLIGAIAILFAMRSGGFMQLFIWASMFYMPVVTVPFIMSIFGFRSSSKSVLIGMSAGITVSMIWELFFKVDMMEVGGLIPGMLANLTFLIGSHYLLKQPGGWIKIDSTQQNSSVLKKNGDSKRY